MPRPSPDLVAGNNRPDGLPARLVIFGAAQGMGRWLAEQVFANVAMQLVLVDVSHHVFEHPVGVAGNPGNLGNRVLGKAQLDPFGL